MMVVCISSVRLCYHIWDCEIRRVMIMCLNKVLRNQLYFKETWSSFITIWDCHENVKRFQNIDVRLYIKDSLFFYNWYLTAIQKSQSKERSVFVVFLSKWEVVQEVVHHDPSVNTFCIFVYKPVFYNIVQSFRL